MKMMFNRLKKQAKEMKRHTLTVYFSIQDPDMPWFAKLLAMLVVAYALSPIDLIPDFIPVIGYLDDLIIVPIGLALVIRLTPQHVIRAAKLKAESAAEKPVNYYTAAIFIFIWFLLLGYFINYGYQYFSENY
ncbi:YkvA family protein [Marinomonas primoryensis]|uniref:YkvA family protein n=1 Tax=Marinomonas primoryensis TaxID=178399 RepID=UPI003D689010